MLTQLGEVAPKALVIGSLSWAALNWIALGPELGSRILIADGHLKICEANYGKEVIASTEQAIKDVPLPRISYEKDAAVQQLQNIQRGPLGKFMDMYSQQTGISVEDAINRYMKQKKLATDQYEAAVGAIKQKTTTKLGKSGDFCGCIADEAVSIAQNEFALYSGTLSFYKAKKIQNLEQLMSRVKASGTCNHVKINP